MDGICNKVKPFSKVRKKESCTTATTIYIEGIQDQVVSMLRKRTVIPSFSVPQTRAHKASCRDIK